MIRGKSLFPLSLAIGPTVGAIVGGANAQQAKLAAADFVIRNVTARGGLQAWCAVQTLSVSGKMEAEGNNLPALPMPGLRRIQRITRPRSSAQAELPFSVQMKRTRKLRVELDFDGRTAVQDHAFPADLSLR